MLEGARTDGELGGSGRFDQCGGESSGLEDERYGHGSASLERLWCRRGLSQSGEKSNRGGDAKGLHDFRKKIRTCCCCLFGENRDPVGKDEVFLGGSDEDEKREG